MKNGHEIVFCSCGKILWQCRCAFCYKAQRTIVNGCDDCKAKLGTKNMRNEKRSRLVIILMSGMYALTMEQAGIVADFILAREKSLLERIRKPLETPQNNDWVKKVELALEVIDNLEMSDA